MMQQMRFPSRIVKHFAYDFMDHLLDWSWNWWQGQLFLAICTIHVIPFPFQSCLTQLVRKEGELGVDLSAYTGNNFFSLRTIFELFAHGSADHLLDRGRNRQL